MVIVGVAKLPMVCLNGCGCKFTDYIIMLFSHACIHNSDDYDPTIFYQDLTMPSVYLHEVCLQMSQAKIIGGKQEDFRDGIHKTLGPIRHKSGNLLMVFSI